MKVIKFGGSSLADAQQVKKVCNIVLSDRERRIVVVSAPGKRFSTDTKVTDMLIDLANKKLEGNDTEDALNDVVQRYALIANELNMGSEIIDEIKKDLENRLCANTYNEDKFLDLMKAAGEDNSAKLFAKYMQSTGENAEYINPKDAGMILSGEYGNARVLPKSYENLAQLAERKTLMVFPGFFGYSESGEVVTFSRGGSDITGSILAAAVNADAYENFTDVDFVYAANPKIITNPKPISKFTYEEMRELSYAGFSVLHEETLEPVYRKSIKVNIRNTNNPSACGTFIIPSVDADDSDPDNPVVGIAADKGFMTIHVEKYMMNREIGFGRRLLMILENEGVSYEHAPSGIDNISLIVKEKHCTNGKLDKIINTIKQELNVDDVMVEHGQAIVMLVGRGMTKTVGIASRATTSLSKANINIRMINQGASEVSIMFGVAEEDADNSVRALYDEFFN